MKKHFIFSIFILIIVIICGAMFDGSIRYSLTDIYNIINASASIEKIELFISFRLSRLLTLFIIGASLVITGIVFQAVMQTPLAEPYILGISSGASLGAIIALLLPISGIYVFTTVSFLGISGSIISLLILYFLGMRKHFSNIRILLTGVIINSFFSALILLITALAREKLTRIVLFLLGNITVPNYKIIIFFYISVSLLFGYFIIMARRLDVISIEDIKARDYGFNVVRFKEILIILSSIVIGFLISYSGIIGFVGLVIPHILRLIIGPKHKKLLILGFIYGGIFLIVADTISRNIVYPEFIPAGVITALIGAPLFIFLIYKSKLYRGF